MKTNDNRPRKVAVVWEVISRCGHWSQVMIDKSNPVQRPSKEVREFYLGRDCAMCVAMTAYNKSLIAKRP